MNKVKFSDAEKLIKNGDVLLFKSTSFPSIGWFITGYTGGTHSHVAIAQTNGRIMCVEQREFKGGRSVDLKHQVELNDGRIDVYRALPTISIPKFDGNTVTVENKIFTDEIAEKIVDDAEALTGSSYGWKNIFKMFLAYFPVIRFFLHRKPHDKVSDVEAFVCSTLVSYTYRKHYIDPCPGIPDEYTNPTDIANSSLFTYLFTLTRDTEE